MLGFTLHRSNHKAHWELRSQKQAVMIASYFSLTFNKASYFLRAYM